MQAPRLGSACLALALGAFAGCTCGKGREPAATDDGGATSASASADAAASGDAGGDASASADTGGLSAPIAAAHLDGGVVVVAGLDVKAKAIRVQRIDGKDAVTTERTIFPGVSWSSEADLRVVPAGQGVAVTWRGKRDEKLVRQLVVLGADLAPRGEPASVTATACATHDAVWTTDGKRVESRAWSGALSRASLPADKDVSMVCGQHRAYAILDEDDGTSFVALGGDAGAGAVSLLAESTFGDDEQRERAEFTVGDDLGVVRLASSGALALREVKGGVPGPLKRLQTKLPRDADVVAVDASPRAIVVVHTDDASEACDGGASTKVVALRIDRATLEESTIELSPGMCGREVGPFFTGPIGDGVSVAWVERVPVRGQSRAPIAGLAHRAVPASGAAAPLGRVEQPADALADAGCDGTRCYAVALARRPGMDAMVPGLARVLRFP